MAGSPRKKAPTDPSSPKRRRSASLPRAAPPETVALAPEPSEDGGLRDASSVNAEPVSGVIPVTVPVEAATTSSPPGLLARCALVVEVPLSELTALEIAEIEMWLGRRASRFVIRRPSAMRDAVRWLAELPRRWRAGLVDAICAALRWILARLQPE